MVGAANDPRSTSDLAVDEREEMGEPGHLVILTEDSACAKVLLVIPLSCGLGATDRFFGIHRHPGTIWKLLSQGVDLGI